MLRDGDVINIPVATDFIYAEGALARPDRYELGPRDSLITLLRLAGDPVPAADANRALLVRWRSSFSAESIWFELPEVYERRVNPGFRPSPGQAADPICSSGTANEVTSNRR